MRKSLYKDGKNLTIFIEDFTSFSIVESKLITALSVENGGKYNDLCRVTSVIGITDGYYDSFRDNFKDRVTKQIKVTEQSYGGDDFLLEMAARYINAIYSSTDAVKDWYKGKPKGQWSVAFPFEGADYVSWSDLEEYYEVYEKYGHRCPECGGAAEIIDFEKQLEAGELKCAECDGTMEATELIMWD